MVVEFKNKTNIHFEISNPFNDHDDGCGCNGLFLLDFPSKKCNTRGGGGGVRLNEKWNQTLGSMIILVMVVMMNNIDPKDWWISHKKKTMKQMVVMKFFLKIMTKHINNTMNEKKAIAPILNFPHYHHTNS